MSFSINCLEITATKKQWEKSKNLYKNLLSEKDYKNLEESKPINKRFFFNDFYEHNKQGELKKTSFDERFNSDTFFGERINVQAIVGKNGSGKSSLLDLLYMAINNFVYMFERCKYKKGVSLVYFVKNLYVNIYYSVDEKVCTLISKGDFIKLETGGGDEKRQFHVDDTIDSPKSLEEIKEIVEPFFYTIVSNYAPQSFISSNYDHDILVFNRASHRSENPKGISNDGYPISALHPPMEFQPSWIDGHFKKNDSYVRSMVINPARKYGTIDMELEKKVSANRLISLFLFAQGNPTGFIPDYTLGKLTYSLNKEIIVKKFWIFNNFDEIENFLSLDDYDEEKIIELEKQRKEKKGDELDAINHEIEVEKIKRRYFRLHGDLQKRYNWGCGSSESLKCAIMYLVYKIDKVVQRYPEFEKYREGNSDSLYEYHDKIDNFIGEITRQTSHAVSKIKQTIRLWDISNCRFVEEHYEDELGDFDSTFDYELYKKKINFSRESLDKIIEQLPPPFYDYEITLNRPNFKDVPISGISSGEMQFLQTLATHAYHIRNLMSIQDENVKYKKVNLVFDELELCFHPEFQRIFIKNLLGMLKSLQKDDYEFNVFIVTHSPFILSDLPSERVLYLKEGSMDTKERKNSFAGNIGEMFYDSFFLESTIGAFAEEKIKRLVNIRQSKNPNGETTSIDAVQKKQLDDEAEQTFNAIGDPIVKCVMEK